MAKQATKKRTFPWTTKIDGTQIKLRLMTADDKDAVLAFARSLPEDDLLFLSFDITQESFVEHWIRRINSGAWFTILVAALRRNHSASLARSSRQRSGQHFSGRNFCESRGIESAKNRRPHGGGT